LGFGGFEAFYAFVDFGEEFFDFGDDSVLFVEGWKCDREITNLIKTDARSITFIKVISKTDES
jgi:hypothetical protein